MVDEGEAAHVCRRLDCEQEVATDHTFCPHHLSKVRHALVDVVGLSADLAGQAQHHASPARHALPGGEAMAMLGPSGDPELWEHKTLSAVLGRIQWNDDVFGHDRETDPPLYVLHRWEERWRLVLDQPTGLKPTIARAADYLHSKVDWANTHKAAELDEFRGDLMRLRNHLENVLGAGVRHATGAPCMHCHVDLIQRYDEHAGLRDDWECPGCQRSYTAAEYWNNVRAAYAAAAVVEIDGREWATASTAATRTGQLTKTIQTWVRRGHVAQVCIIGRGRDSLAYVSIDDVNAKVPLRRKGCESRRAVAM